jgi:nitrate/nitrite transport system ATP-binding protein
MRQRVGIARAFAIEPQILLMDEPFGALDALTRGSIQDQLVEICAQTGQTVFMITHDVDEAIYLSDRVFLMSNGPNARIAEQVEVPFRRPRSRTELSRHQDYYELRTRLLDFLARAGAQGPERTGRDLSERAEPEETVGADGLEPLRSQRLEVSS